MRDFTLKTYQLLLSSLKSAGYDFVPVAGYLTEPSDSTIILRHDVDARPGNALQCAEMEHSMGLSGTYYFRAGPESYNESVIKAIEHLGHEIGYHYEDLAATKGDTEKAIVLFAENLARLRRLVPVETICMHGSPLSKHDNRLLWEKYDYRDFGIRGEPYLDTRFGKVYYLTDTGRCWDGERFNLRDRLKPRQGKKTIKEAILDKVNSESPEIRMHDSFDIIAAVKNRMLPSVIMMTIHPQRWNSRSMPWIAELILQNCKNVIKGAVNKIGRQETGCILLT